MRSADLSFSLTHSVEDYLKNNKPFLYIVFEMEDGRNNNINNIENMSINRHDNMFGCWRKHKK